LGEAEQREALAEYVHREHPGFTILIDSAGIRRRVP
jgi:short-subunit dehydrogenase involved in D-alanine esterification of teichoic acids